MANFYTLALQETYETVKRAKTPVTNLSRLLVMKFYRLATIMKRYIDYSTVIHNSFGDSAFFLAISVSKTIRVWDI